MNLWIARVSRWAMLLGGFGALWMVVYLFGRFGVPAADGFDQYISAALNPDHELPGFDEFFRALTDYTNFLIAVPLISLVIAGGMYRLTGLAPRRAVVEGAIGCGLWWVIIIVISRPLHLSWNALFSLFAIGPGVIVFGATPPMLIQALDGKRWVTGILCCEGLVFVVLWGAHKLWWNHGLVAANYILLPAVLMVFGGVIYAFHAMDGPALGRFQRVFWLVLLSILLTDQVGTEPIKERISRPRPLNDAHKPWNEQLRPIPEETLHGSNSYPSGHTSGTFALLTPLFWWVRDRRGRAGILAWGTLQGVARVYTVAHFTTDCILGGILGFGTGTLVFFLLDGPLLRRAGAIPDQVAARDAG